MTTDTEATIVTDQPRAKRTNPKRLALLALILLPVAVLANYQTILAVASGQRTLKGVIYGFLPTQPSEFGMVQIPENIGNKEAKVTIEVFVRGGESCHAPTIFLGEALGKVDPEHIQVVFRNSAKPEDAKRAGDMKLGCEQGIAINGKAKYDLPGDGKGGERVVYLTGGHERHWKFEDLRYILDKELKAAYKGKGLALSAEELTQRVDGEQKRIMDEARERAKAEKDSKGGPPPPDPSK